MLLGMSVTLSQEQYTALISLARAGCATPDKIRVFETFLKDIEKTNGIKRYALLIQWQEQDSPLPLTVDFPPIWPPQLRTLLERTDRAIAKADVLKALQDRAKKPTNVLVTRDLGGIVGWTRMEDFFIT